MCLFHAYLHLEESFFDEVDFCQHHTADDHNDGNNVNPRDFFSQKDVGIDDTDDWGA